MTENELRTIVAEAVIDNAINYKGNSGPAIDKIMEAIQAFNNGRQP